MGEQDLDRVKDMEMKLAAVFQQKEHILQLMQRMSTGMPSQSLQRIVEEILETVHEQFRLEEEMQTCEEQLNGMEGELRGFAKKDVAGASLLCTKVINLRKDVDRQRQQLRDIQEQRDLILKRRESLEAELKCTELNERRMHDVALETEKSLTEVKYELATTKKELQFSNNNRKDLEVALKSTQEEKRMVERELLSIRAQLQMKANQGSKQSTIMNI